MSQDPSQIISKLLADGGFLEDKEKLTHYAQTAFLNLLESGRYGDVGKPPVKRFLSMAMQPFINGNIESIFQFSQSPIERMFLCCFLLNSIYLSYPWLFNIIGPVDMETWPDLHRANYNAFEDILVRLESDPEFDLGLFLQEMDEETSVPEDEKKAMKSHILYSRAFNLHSSFHISLQPTIKLEGRNKRPDMFVWVPARPEIKLVVECDGFAYHSDRKTFSSDRSRDRMFQKHGYRVFRFSGQEIYSNPAGYARELAEYLISLHNPGTEGN